MGSVVKTTVADGMLGPDVNHHKNALAPNVVHAADAALLHVTFANWDQPVMVIHDCVLARSCDLRQMNIEIRHHFVEMYKEPVLQNWADQVGVTIPDGLIKNTLDIEKVNDSDYFFC
jgi:DNA-directed RNA polymerase